MSLSKSNLKQSALGTFAVRLLVFQSWSKYFVRETMAWQLSIPISPEQRVEKFICKFWFLIRSLEILWLELIWENFREFFLFCHLLPHFCWRHLFLIIDKGRKRTRIDTWRDVEKEFVEFSKFDIAFYPFPNSMFQYIVNSVIVTS